MRYVSKRDHLRMLLWLVFVIDCHAAWSSTIGSFAWQELAWAAYSIYLYSNTYTVIVIVDDKVELVRGFIDEITAEPL